MTGAVLAQTAARIAEHVRTHVLPHIEVVLHGGEPLLAGPEFLALVATTIRSHLPAGVDLDLRLQTNALLLDEKVLDVLGEHEIRIGVSLDGEPATHDAHRSHAGGHGSHAAVERALGLLRSEPHRHLFAGLLCVIDLRSDPLATYERLLAHGPPMIDFLLPHANWSNPPSRALDAQTTTYGGWLIAAFDRWYSAPRRETSVRFFDEIIRGVVGRPSRVETIGLSPARDVVIETDGAIEQIDALKSAYEGGASTGLHVDDDSFDAALLLPQFAARQIGAAALAAKCQACELRDVCGGGFYPHRFERGRGFRNPSVYCDDLADLIRHVQRRVENDLLRLRARTAG